MLSIEDLTETGQLMFLTVSRMDKPMSARQVARKTGRHINTARVYLAQLADVGYLDKDKVYERPGGRWEYEYFPSANVGAGPEKEAEEWFLGEGFQEAIDAAKPHWRDGEQFTRKEVAEWREANIRRRR